ncbi:hypothetical protein XPA_000551 [Xanthoria parietina]
MAFQVHLSSPFLKVPPVFDKKRSFICLEQSSVLGKRDCESGGIYRNYTSKSGDSSPRSTFGSEQSSYAEA